MKSPRRKPRTIVGLFFCLWFFYVFLRWQKRSDSVEDIEAKLSGEEEPEIIAKVSRQVWEMKWDESSDCSQSTWIVPFVIRGFASGWKAVQKWDFQWLHDIDATADVFVSPTLKFTYYDEELGKEILRKDGPTALPNVKTKMAVSEAVERMTSTRWRGLENLYYNKKAYGPEHYYARFDIDSSMNDDISLDAGVIHCLNRSADLPRVWVSVRGSVSPMHWDGHHSCLIQIRGRKRMIFYDPLHQRKFGSYPPTHLLWRRAKFDPTNPDYNQFPRTKDIGGSLAILEPGDMVCFPKKWLHYTDCLTHSISLTLRFNAE